MLAAFQKEDLREYAVGRRGKYEEALEKMVEIPTVSVEPERKADVRRRRGVCGFAPRVFRGEGPALRDEGTPHRLRPLRRGANLPTITVYNHLDVQPADGPDWKTAPFDFVRRRATVTSAAARRTTRVRR